MKKILIIISIIILIVLLFGKKERVFYLPFDIPGSQMAATIPPFGIFIEKKYKYEGSGCGTILAHEKIHWQQYRRMGFFKYYSEYLKEYIKNGRIHKNWMEVEARKLSSCK